MVSKSFTIFQTIVEFFSVTEIRHVRSKNNVKLICSWQVSSKVAAQNQMVLQRPAVEDEDDGDPGQGGGGDQGEGGGAGGAGGRGGRGVGGRGGRGVGGRGVGGRGRANPGGPGGRGGGHGRGVPKPQEIRGNGEGGAQFVTIRVLKVEYIYK